MLLFFQAASKRVKIALGALLLLVAVGVTFGIVLENSASSRQDEINHSTDDWQCILNYGDQSNC